MFLLGKVERRWILGWFFMYLYSSQNNVKRELNKIGRTGLITSMIGNSLLIFALFIFIFAEFIRQAPSSLLVWIIIAIAVIFFNIASLTFNFLALKNSMNSMFKKSAGALSILCLNPISLVGGILTLYGRVVTKMPTEFSY